MIVGLSTEFMAVDTIFYGALGEAWIERMVETPKFNIETQRVKVPPNQDWSSVGSESCAGPGNRDR